MVDGTLKGGSDIMNGNSKHDNRLPVNIIIHHSIYYFC